MTFLVIIAILLFLDAPWYIMVFSCVCFFADLFFVGKFLEAVTVLEGICEEIVEIVNEEA